MTLGVGLVNQILEGVRGDCRSFQEEVKISRITPEDFEGLAATELNIWVQHLLQGLGRDFKGFLHAKALGSVHVPGPGENPFQGSWEGRPGGFA